MANLGAADVGRGLRQLGAEVLLEEGGAGGFRLRVPPYECIALECEEDFVVEEEEEGRSMAIAAIVSVEDEGVTPVDLEWRC